MFDKKEPRQYEINVSVRIRETGEHWESFNVDRTVHMPVVTWPQMVAIIERFHQVEEEVIQKIKNNELP
jgi:hypothetical protein